MALPRLGAGLGLSGLGARLGLSRMGARLVLLPPVPLWTVLKAGHRNP